MDTGKIFLGAVFLLIAAYIFIAVDSSAAKIFGGGVLTVLGVVTIIRAYLRGKKKPAAAPEPAASAAPAPEPAAPAEPKPAEPAPKPPARRSKTWRWGLPISWPPSTA